MVHRPIDRVAARRRPIVVLTSVGIVLILVTGLAAHAQPQVQSTLRRVRRIDLHLDRIRSHHRMTGERRGRLRLKLHRELQRLGSPSDLGEVRWRIARAHLLGGLSALRSHARRSDRYMRRRVTRLTQQRAEANIWLATWGVFRRCPVAGPNVVADNFGVVVRIPNVPVHIHMGNDISAAAGTPIVAPFDGYATASAGELGGLEVRVAGLSGYVYNAHLAAFGALGYVRAGDVIGYVGSTGDATSSHDHFEWHPGGGGAVDPHALLSVVC